MRFLAIRSGLVLLGVLLAACVTSSSSVQEDEAAETVSSWEQGLADPSCVVPLCDKARCALWRCQDVVVAEDSPAVVSARGPGVLRPPLVVGNPQRWWGRSIAAPTNAEPVFEIPWHNWNTRGQFALKDASLLCLIPPREPLEKHHIFPQEEFLASWFKIKGIDIHAFTILLPKSFHTWLHSGGPKGGQWNEAWRQFRRENNGASPEEIWRFAGELMSRFGVNGPLVPYHCP